jgi:hypothetical protein
MEKMGIFDLVILYYFLVVTRVLPCLWWDFFFLMGIEPVNNSGEYKV